MTWLAVFIGGGLGSLARFGVGKLTAMFWTSSFPMGTLLANVLSCVILGIVAYKIPNLNSFNKSLILIGFCGGFSTFSTFSNETLMLMKQNEWLFVIANVVLSISACLFVLWVLSKN